MTATGVPPGWYADPWRQSTWRWWSGVEWTPYTDQWPASAEAERGPLRAGGIAILGLVAGIGLATIVGIVVLLAGYDETSPAFLLGSSIGLYAGFFGSCVVAVRIKGTGSLADLGLVRPRWVDVALGAGFAVAGVIMVSVLGAVLDAISSDLVPGPRTDLERPIDEHGALGIAVVYLVAVIFAPVFEELYFRGLVQGTLTARWGSAAGIVVQAALFSSMHIVPGEGLGNVGIVLIIGAVGLGLGGIRRGTGRLSPAIFAHAGYNAIIVTIGMVAT